MRLGMIVRCDVSGLGHQSWDLWRHLQPAKTVAVIPISGGAAHLTQNPDRYHDALVADWNPAGGGSRLAGAAAHLRDCDVVISAETLYDPNLHATLTRYRTATVIIANPELYSGEQATAIWSPTPWLNAQTAATARQPVRVVPHPVPVDRFPNGPVADQHSRPHRIVHPTATAMGDRNGTGIVTAIEGQLRQDRFSIDYVGPATPLTRGRGRFVDNWWEREDGAWLSLIPRRYGGLCLPALEAFAAGVPVVMPRCGPQDGLWPVIGIPTRRGRPINTKGGRVNTWTMDPGPLVSTIHDLDQRPDLWAKAADAVRRFAWANRWEAIEGQYREALTALS